MLPLILTLPAPAAAPGDCAARRVLRHSRGAGMGDAASPAAGVEGCGGRGTRGAAVHSSDATTFRAGGRRARRLAAAACSADDGAASSGGRRCRAAAGGAHAHPPPTGQRRAPRPQVRLSRMGWVGLGRAAELQLPVSVCVFFAASAYISSLTGCAALALPPGPRRPRYAIQRFGSARIAAMLGLPMSSRGAHLRRQPDDSGGSRRPDGSGEGD